MLHLLLASIDLAKSMEGKLQFYMEEAFDMVFEYLSRQVQLDGESMEKGGKVQLLKAVDQHYLKHIV